MSKSIGKVFGSTPYVSSNLNTSTDFAGRDENMQTTELLQRISEMFPQTEDMPKIQDLLDREAQNNTLNYDETPFVQNNFANQESLNSSTYNDQPYIFSEEMRNRLGMLESGNDYSKINTYGGGIGALGKYQIRRDGFKDAGYINSDNQWSGKNSINSTNDYLNNAQLQEKALDDFMKVKYRQLQNNGSRQYLGISIRGIVNNFAITDTGLLAASHREGAGAVHNYLSHLERDENGRYYMNYDSISDTRQREMFKRIETRLREFEK